MFIRGIGTITTSPGVEPSVSTVVDGVVLDRPGQATAEMLDVDRIEVLRGPQGTLFGKNASAGVINIVTTDPTAETHGYADGSWFSGGNEYRVKGGVSGALGRKRIAGLGLRRVQPLRRQCRQSLQRRRPSTAMSVTARTPSSFSCPAMI